MANNASIRIIIIIIVNCLEYKEYSYAAEALVLHHQVVFSTTNK